MPRREMFLNTTDNTCGAGIHLSLSLSLSHSPSSSTFLTTPGNILERIPDFIRILPSALKESKSIPKVCISQQGPAVISEIPGRCM